MKVLIVDDDPKYRSFVARGLQESGLDCEEAADGAAALDRLRGGGVDLVLLDVMMPGLQGWDVLETLKGEGIDVPVIYVTARDAVDERVKGLRLGADDYIVKPFAFQELLARIDVVRRRRRPHALRVGELEIDPLAGEARRGGRVLDLTRYEMALLRALAEARGKPVSRRELLQKVWHMDFDPGTNVVEVQVRRLRLKVDGPFESPLIHTVRGEGYALSETAP